MTEFAAWSEGSRGKRHPVHEPKLSLSKAAIDHNRISYGLTLMVLSVLLSPLDRHLLEARPKRRFPRPRSRRPASCCRSSSSCRSSFCAARCSISPGKSALHALRGGPFGGDHAFLHHHAEGPWRWPMPSPSSSWNDHPHHSRQQFSSRRRSAAPLHRLRCRLPRFAARHPAEHAGSWLGRASADSHAFGLAVFLL